MEASGDALKNRHGWRAIQRKKHKKILKVKKWKKV